MAASKYYSEIFKDDHLLVVNKQPGVPVIPGRNLKCAALRDILKQRYKQEIFVNHRIDRFTSGIVVFALDSATHSSLNEAFKLNKVQKSYQCISAGTLKDGSHVVDAPIFIDSRSPKVRIDPKGKNSLSRYKGIESVKNFHKLEIQIETGRTHQVRVHLAHEKLPILGDEVYNNRPFYYLKDLKKNFSENKLKEHRPIISRQALHAYAISFEHPHTNEFLTFTADWPKDMRACWNILKKYGA